MGSALQRLGATLPQILLVATVIELAVYRIAVQLLEPQAAGQAELPFWHQALAYLGLFVFYFASIFAAVVAAVSGVLVAREKSPMPAFLRLPLGGVVIAVAGLALIASISVPTSGLSFALEALFTASVLVILVGQLVTRGDIGTKIGIFLFAAPLIVHFCGQFVIRYVSGEEGLWNGELETFDQVGLWLLILAAVAAPYCFSPKPFAEAAARLEPLVAGAFAGLIGAIVIREDYKVGADLAARGLGITLGPAAPMSLIALYLMALAAITWTLLACLLSPSPARRQIGIGVGLIVVGGYSFNWPLQYLSGMVGLLAIGSAAGAVKLQERALRRPMKFQSPSIAAPAWQNYLSSVLDKLQDRHKDGGKKPSMVTVREEDVYRSYLVGELDDVPIRVQVVRFQTTESDEEDELHAAIASIEVLCGPELEESKEPMWTLYCAGTGKSDSAHPAPPAISARPEPVGDEAFDGRYEVRSRGHFAEIFDKEMRERCASLLDGWVAGWEGGIVAYRICPGQGAPLDSPVPISDLAFRPTAASPDKLVRVVELLCDIARKMDDEAP